jgi:hypothetical protein
MNVLKWILVQCATATDDAAVLHRELGCAHYHETPDSESLSIQQHVSVFCRILIQCTSVTDNAVLSKELASAHC